MNNFDIEFFNKHGYLHVKSVVDFKIIETIKFFLDDRVKECLKILFEYFNLRSEVELLDLIKKASFEKNFYKDIPNNIKMIMSGHFDLETRLDKKIHELFKTKEVMSAISTLLDSREISVHLPPVARFVIPGNKWAGVPLHNDISYNMHLKDFVVMWVPLVPINEKCMGVIVCENTGLPIKELIKSDIVENLFWQKALCPPDSFKRKHISMDVGDALFLNKYNFHQSGLNNSEYTRISIDSRFFRTKDRSEKHFLDLNKNEIIEPFSN